MKTIKSQTGTSLTADFQENTWTFEMEENFVMVAGEFSIVPKNQFTELITLVQRLKFAISKDEKAKMNSEITNYVFQINESFENMFEVQK
jgi:hypothetical protein